MSKYFAKYKHGRKRKVNYSTRGYNSRDLNGKVTRPPKYSLQS